MKKEENNNVFCFLPVYINKTKLLDINSILFDGYSEFSEMNFQNEDKNSSTHKGKVNGGIGMSIFSLGTQLETGNTNNNSLISNVALKKIQTSSSLLANTVNLLKINKILSEYPACSGQFVEIKGVFKNNSLIDLFEQISNMLEFAKLSSKLETTNDKTNYKDMNEKVKTIKQMLTAKANNKSELVYETDEYIYVVKLDESCLYNCDLNDIYNNKLDFFGQVKGIYENYKFFSDTPLSKFNSEKIEEFIEGIKEFVNNGIYDIDFEIMTNCKGKKVIELDIIAIYRKFDK